ncbi:MAG: hypothetical protein SVZ03_04690 [Spirochaetota bacterium]|nr:hypothetical protein [Spirochaetota bacterium]
MNFFKIFNYLIALSFIGLFVFYLFIEDIHAEKNIIMNNQILALEELDDYEEYDELEDDDDSEEYDDSEESFFDDAEGSFIEYKLNGFIEIENVISTYKEQELKDTNKKNEIRKNIKFNLGTEYLKLRMDMNIYVNSNIIDECVNDEYIYTEDFEVSRNLRLSNKSFEVSFNELFIGFGAERFRLRVGNQIYAWGTADTLNPTTYFNPMNARELFLVDEDEMRVAVPSCSGMIFFNNLNLEIVFAPVHVPMLIAASDNFWAFKYEEEPFPVNISEPDKLEIDPSNYAYGGRLSCSIWGTDLSISGYHGPDIEPLMVPMRTNYLPYNEPVTLVVDSKYYITNYFGFDFSKSVGPFTLQFEIAYSPDRSGIVDQGNLEEISDPEELELPFVVKKSKYLSYSAGFNYYVPLNRILEGHEGETVLLLEWHEALYFDNELMPPTITDMIATGLTDSFFSSQLNIFIMGMIDTKNKALLFLPKIGFDFMNGFTIDLSYGYIKDFKDDEEINMEEISLFSFYRDNDVIILEARYEY